MDRQRVTSHEPRFIVRFEGDAPICSTLTELLEANGDFEELCVWARAARAGDVFKTGGGAAPYVETRRMSADEEAALLEARREGRRIGSQGNSRSWNRFPEGSLEHAAWLEGYDSGVRSRTECIAPVEALIFAQQP